MNRWKYNGNSRSRLQVGVKYQIPDQVPSSSDGNLLNMLIITIMKTHLFGQAVVIVRLKQNIKSTSTELSKRHLGIVPRAMLQFPGNIILV